MALQLNAKLYKWKIKDPLIVQKIKTSRKGDCVDSPFFSMHGFRWYMQFFKESSIADGNTMIYLNLASLPPKVSSLSIKKEFIIDELNVRYSTTNQFDKQNMNWGWPKNTKDFKNCNQLTIKCKITLINVYDKDGNDISDQYLKKKNTQVTQHPSQSDDQLKIYEARLNSLTNQMDAVMKNMKQMQQTINDLVLKSNEEQKNNDMQKQININDLAKKVQILMNNNNNLDVDKEKLKEWVNKKLKLPQYFDIFIENGFESLDDIQLLNMEQLNKIGIDKIGHKMRILHQIIQLKQNNNVVAFEGNVLQDTKK